MQEALLALTKYWTDRGCMMVQPFNTEVGAGTLNPATVLRVLGPEPWKVAYVEPSVRPDDARYGENPNRLQTHTQFQVILKPDPGNPQELYLGSLAAIGIDTDAHDVRFVEDNWASPALGAWGLGWEVWLDGMEISQFTYFQQAGGTPLNPVSVEITYGVERIMMALQKVAHFKEIAYAPGISYGEVFAQSEYEMSRYYLDDANVDATKRLFEEYASEARRMLDARLPVAAHYCVLKCSHTFNILDSRGAVSTTERAKAFSRMRNLSREVAALWQERRKELDYPLGVTAPPEQATLAMTLSKADQPSTLLFEIGTEELPAAEVTRAAESLRQSLETKLARTRLEHGEIRTYSTPRRIVATIDAVSPQEPDTRNVVRGPKLDIAFDGDGRPSKAALGFARSQQIDIADLEKTTVAGVDYIAATKTAVGRNAVEVFSDLLTEIISELRADKNMRWNDPRLSYSRPVRWILALLGEIRIPIAVSTVASGTTTRVHRGAPQPLVEVKTADGYQDFLKSQGIVLDGVERRAQIIASARELTLAVEGSVDTENEAALINEIANIIEQPNAILGSFDKKYLELPSEILTTVMRKHQRYLPVRDASGELLPYFVAVANGACDRDVVRAGYEAVLRARYEDAAFFWRADLRTSLDALKEGLSKLAFEERLGSVADRANRIAGIAMGLADQLGAGPGKSPLSEQERKVLARAAKLAKFDLSSQMVIELTSLAGTMAKEYSLRAGEDPKVAQALWEMELPRFTGDQHPHSAAGALLALADRLDLLAGLFAVGANPTGSSDPFALRRAALGAMTILRTAPALRDISLTSGLNLAAEQLQQQGVEVTGEALNHAHEFTVGRYEQQLRDADHESRLVAAVLPLMDYPARSDMTLEQLRKLCSDNDFSRLATALQRIRRIVPENATAEYDASQLKEPAEIALVIAFEKICETLNSTDDLAEFFDTAKEIIPQIDGFFEEVHVMSDNLEVRSSRLGLLASIRDASANVLDWRALNAS
jgi:glycyl-tRNA synthetase